MKTKLHSLLVVLTMIAGTTIALFAAPPGKLPSPRRINIPKVEIPKVEIPEFEIPKVEIPEFEIPEFETLLLVVGPLPKTESPIIEDNLLEQISNTVYQRPPMITPPPTHPYDFKDDTRNPYLPIKSSTAVRLRSNNGKDNKNGPYGESTADHGDYNYNNSHNNHSCEERHAHDHSDPELNDTTINVVDSVTNERVIILSDSLSLPQIRSDKRNNAESAPKRKCSSYCCPQQEIKETPNDILFPNEAIKSEEKETLYLP